MANELTQEALKVRLTYDPETGHFLRRDGTRAGRVKGRGYRYIKIYGRLWLEHRLAFLYMTGEWPPVFVDHINRTVDDNRWVNLRLANHSQNGWNQKLSRRNKSGVKGVCWCKNTRRWMAYIRAENKLHRLGSFRSKNDAVWARIVAAKKFHGEFAS